MSYADLSDIDLHDALLTRIEIDIESSSVMICLTFYESPGSTTRKRGVIRFSNVSASSLILDLTSLVDNIRSGNINSWAPLEKNGTTHFHLLDGFISLNSTDVVFDLD